MFAAFSITGLIVALIFLEEARQFWWLYLLAVALAVRAEIKTNSPGEFVVSAGKQMYKTVRAPFAWLNDTLDNFGPVFVGVLAVVAWGIYQICMFLRATYFSN